MSLFRILPVMFALMFIACRDKPDAAKRPAVAAPPPKPAGIPVTPAAPPPSVSGETPKPAKDENPDLTALNAAYRKFWQDNQSPPAKLEILVSRGYLKNLPVPPKGKRYSVNWEKMEVSLVKE